MVRDLPFGIDNWSFSHLYEAVARRQSCLLAGADEIDVRPLIAMIVHVIDDLAE
jgi:hypothetical protein